MSATGHYDQDLLASAPKPTKELLQGGYTTELLNPTHGRNTSPHPVQSEDAHLAPQSDPERDSLSPSKEFNDTKKPLPFWRTTKGIVIIIVVILIVLGAVIGGGVGGTRGKSKPSSAPATPTTTMTSSNAAVSPTPSVDVGGGLTIAGTGSGAANPTGVADSATTAEPPSVSPPPGVGSDSGGTGRS
jgi:hypothetical protein